MDDAWSVGAGQCLPLQRGNAEIGTLPSWGIVLSERSWVKANRNNWDEQVAVHLGPRGWDLSLLRAGRGKLDGIVEKELVPVSGKRLLHLQCHFDKDTLALAQRGAEVTGLDFSAPAIAAAKSLAVETGLYARARFVLAELDDALTAITEARSFDLVFVTWGAICWLPDIRFWARIVAHFLKLGGSIYLAEGHPAVMVLDDEAPQVSGDPGFLVPYFRDNPFLFDKATDWTDSIARLTNSTTYNWIHPLGDVATALIGAGLRLDWLHEHDAITWPLFRCLTRDSYGLYRWPNKKWLPLSYSLQATLPRAIKG